jgi:uncharacterized protein (DUF2267 family)
MNAKGGLPAKLSNRTRKLGIGIKNMVLNATRTFRRVKMKYRELIKKVQGYSGFSDSESEDALEMMVESIAVHLTEGGRKNFASQLPQRLKDMALSVYATPENSKEDLIEQFMEIEHIDESRAKKQIHAAWNALKDAMSAGEIEHVRAQLPNHTVAFLH